MAGSSPTCKSGSRAAIMRSKYLCIVDVSVLEAWRIDKDQAPRGVARIDGFDSPVHSRKAVHQVKYRKLVISIIGPFCRSWVIQCWQKLRGHVIIISILDYRGVLQCIIISHHRHSLHNLLSALSSGAYSPYVRKLGSTGSLSPIPTGTYHTRHVST